MNGSPDEVQAAREWLEDCGLPTHDPRTLVDALYVGGWAQFVEDGQ
jgi:hypothetical protein